MKELTRRYQELWCRAGLAHEGVEQQVLRAWGAVWLMTGIAHDVSQWQVHDGVEQQQQVLGAWGVGQGDLEQVLHMI